MEGGGRREEGGGERGRGRQGGTDGASDEGMQVHGMAECQTIAIVMQKGGHSGRK